MPSSREELDREFLRTDAELCRRDLKEFVQGSWPYLVPASPLIAHFALDAICDHLAAVSKGQIKKLIINVPPGMAKSSIVAVLWPIWEWTFRPQIQWMFATYTKNLTFRDAGRRRDIIRGPWYQARFGQGFQVTKEGVEFLINDHAGHMFSTSTGGQTTGWRGDRLILDDPQDPKGAESEIKRESTIEWLTREWPTRINRGSQFGAQVLIQQRLHELDATGLYLQKGDWVHLKIPLEYRGEKVRTPIYAEPREKAGEIISEAIYPPRETEDLKRTLGPYAVSGQLQQEPAPPEGGLIKRAWIREYTIGKDKRLEVADQEFPYRIDPGNCIRFATVDPAITEKDLENQSDPDYTVMAAWAAFSSKRGPLLLLLDLIRDRMEGPEILAKLAAFHKAWSFAVIGVETVAFQKMLAQYARREGLPIREIGQKEDSIYRIDKDKISRAMSATPLMADGRFYAPTYAPWLGEYIKELTTFPNAAHDDQVDATAYGVAIGQKVLGFLADPGDNGKPEPKTLDAGYNVNRDDEGGDPLAAWRLERP